MSRNKNRQWLAPMTSRGESYHESDTFTCSVDGVTACSKAPEVNILFDSRLWQSVVGLCERFNTEWMAYLIGDKNEGGNYEIKSLSFPEQSAGGAHVRREPDSSFRPEEGTVGVIHSHVNMSAFFSSTDKAHANWPVEIVVNRKGEYEVSTRVTLPCGDSMRRSSRILLLTGGQLDDMENKLKESLKKGEDKESSKPQPVVLWSSDGQHSWPSYDGAFYAARQEDDIRLLGGKYLMCPICQNRAIRCPHSLSAMEQYEDTQKGITP